MSLPEVIPSALPQFVRNTPRTNFSNSVVPPGAFLLFAESDGNGGSNLIKKLPDVSFTEIGGGGGNFYKCASVDTVNHTWTGYLAIKNSDNTYSFEGTATAGLSFSLYTPEIGYIYPDGCLSRLTDLNLKIDDYVFFAPLENSSQTAETGQILSTEGSITFTSVGGKACADTSAGSVYTADTTEFHYGLQPRTYSVEIYYTDYHNTGDCLFSHGAESAYLLTYLFGLNYNGLSVWSQGQDKKFTYPDKSRWVRVTVVYDGTAFRVYYGLQYMGEYIRADGCGNETLCFGNYYNAGTTDWFFNGYMRNALFYNRVLSSEEIRSVIAQID